MHDIYQRISAMIVIGRYIEVCFITIHSFLFTDQRHFALMLQILFCDKKEHLMQNAAAPFCTTKQQMWINFLAVKICSIWHAWLSLDTSQQLISERRLSMRRSSAAAELLMITTHA